MDARITNNKNVFIVKLKGGDKKLCSYRLTLIIDRSIQNKLDLVSELEII